MTFNPPVPERIALLLLPAFSMLAFAGAVAPLREANRISGRALYDWWPLSLDGGPVAAGNGLTLQPRAAAEDAGAADMRLVCCDLDDDAAEAAGLRDWLLDGAERGAMLGGIGAGVIALLRLGLLDGRRVAVDPELRRVAGNLGNNVELVDTGYVIDGSRLTASSGAAALDMMLEVVATRHGQGLGARVSARLKPGAAPPVIPTLSRPRVQHPKLLTVISQMETHIEEPISIEDLAESVDLSKRQLERLFQRYLGQSPAKYYMAQRLARAQLLLAQTAMPIVEVAQASGFVAVSHFSKSYREHFGHTPRMERIPSFRRNGRNGSGTRVIA